MSTEKDVGIGEEQSHTPLPWKFDKDEHGCKFIKGGKLGTNKQAQYQKIAYTVGLHNEFRDFANAEFIVKACNAYYSQSKEIIELKQEVRELKEFQNYHEHAVNEHVSNLQKITSLEQEVERLREAARTAVADYMRSEGCSCCQNIKAHKEHTKRLAELLDVPMYEDESGYKFSLFRSPQNIQDNEHKTRSMRNDRKGS